MASPPGPSSEDERGSGLKGFRRVADVTGRGSTERGMRKGGVPVEA